jgi:hypothetical protein
MSHDDEPMLATACGNFELPPADLIDPVIEAYKKDVDRTLLRENLKLTVAERLHKFQCFMDSLEQLREVGRRAREYKK